MTVKRKNNFGKLEQVIPTNIAGLPEKLKKNNIDSIMFVDGGLNRSRFTPRIRGRTD